MKSRPRLLSRAIAVLLILAVAALIYVSWQYMTWRDQFDHDAMRPIETPSSSSTRPADAPVRAYP